VECCANWSANSSAFELPISYGEKLAATTASSSVLQLATGQATNTAAKVSFTGADSMTTSTAAAGDTTVIASSGTQLAGGTIAGVAVGSAVGAALLVGGCCFAGLWWRRRKRKDAEMGGAPRGGEDARSGDFSMGAPTVDGLPFSEMAADGKELPAPPLLLGSRFSDARVYRGPGGQIVTLQDSSPKSPSELPLQTGRIELSTDTPSVRRLDMMSELP
jgi:hypothetical protein